MVTTICNGIVHFLTHPYPNPVQFSPLSPTAQSATYYLPYLYGCANSHVLKIEPKLAAAIILCLCVPNWIFPAQLISPGFKRAGTAGTNWHIFFTGCVCKVYFALHLFTKAYLNIQQLLCYDRISDGFLFQLNAERTFLSRGRLSPHPVVFPLIRMQF